MSESIKQSKVMKNITFLAFIFFSALFISCDDEQDQATPWTPLVATDPGESADIGIVNGGLYNGDMELTSSVEPNLPSGWNDRIAFFVRPNNYEFSQTSENAFEGLSASIEGLEIRDQYGYFRQVIINPNIPEGAAVRIRGKVKTATVDSRQAGFVLSVVGYGSAFSETLGEVTEVPVFFSTTRPETGFIAGNNDWAEYTAEPDFNSTEFDIINGLERIEVRLEIGGSTKGFVYFDDIIVEYQ